jgi:DNA-3-methyladenine glycosylase II
MLHTIMLHPTPPYDFSLSAMIFSRGDPAIRNYKNGVFIHTLCVGDLTRIVTEVRAKGSVDAPLLELTIHSPMKPEPETMQEVENLVENILNIHENLGSFYSDVQNDPIMKEISIHLKGLKSPTTPTVFEALVDSIIEQQISLTAARSMEEKLVRKFGVRFALEGRKYFCFPTPTRLARGTPEQFRSCGLSSRKGEYIRDISRQINDGKLTLEVLRQHQDIEEIIEELMTIRGIGRWTAELTILRGMHRVEAIPADDLGVRKLISHYYRNDEKISGVEARNIAEQWGRWKGLAAFYLIVAGLLGIPPPFKK